MVLVIAGIMFLSLLQWCFTAQRALQLRGSHPPLLSHRQRRFSRSRSLEHSHRSERTSPPSRRPHCTMTYPAIASRFWNHFSAVCRNRFEEQRDEDKKRITLLWRSSSICIIYTYTLKNKRIKLLLKFEESVLILMTRSDSPKELVFCDLCFYLQGCHSIKRGYFHQPSATSAFLAILTSRNGRGWRA